MIASETIATSQEVRVSMLAIAAPKIRRTNIAGA
jgi:hypothetical protein